MRAGDEGRSRRRAAGPRIALLLAAIAGSGCATSRALDAYTDGAPVVFAGTRIDVAAMRDRSRAVRRYAVDPPRHPAIDLPFSFVADAVLLPFLLPGVALVSLFD